MVCCPSRVSLCRMQLSEAHLGQSVRRGLGAVWPSWLRGHGWGLGAGGFRAPNPAFPAKENPWGVRFGLRRPPGKQQGPGIKGQPSSALPNGEPKAWAKTACVDFLRRGTVRLWFAAQGEFPFAECSSQKLVMGRRCDGASALCGRAGSGGMAEAWAQKPFAHPILHSPRRRTRGECASGSGDPQESSRAQGSRGCPAQLRPMESGGPVSKTDSGAFLSGGALELWFAAKESFPLQNEVPRSSF